MAVLRRRLNATVLVPRLRDPFPAVLASIFVVVAVHASPPLCIRSRCRTETDREKIYARLLEDWITKSRLVLAVDFSQNTAIAQSLFGTALPLK
jgi:hypothetical protein